MVKGIFANLFKIVLFIVNIIFWLLGCVIFGFGIYYLVQIHSNKKAEVVGSVVAYAPSIVLIVAGVVVFIVGFAGCCGAVRESRTLLNIYAALVGIIFVLELTAGIVAYTQRNKLEHVVTDGMKGTMDKYWPKTDVGNIWDALQKEITCCGVKGPGDWKNASLWATRQQGLFYPSSCCTNLTTSPGQDFQVCRKYDDRHAKGCYKAIEDYLHSKLNTVAGIAIGVAVFEVVVIIMACVLQGILADSDYSAV